MREHSADSISCVQRTKCPCIVAPVGFLQHSECFNHEEPYAFRYQADGLDKLTNMDTAWKDVTICDLRGHEEMASLDRCGFEVKKLRSTIPYESFESEERIKQEYVENIKRQLAQDYGAVHVCIERVRVRRRHRDWPISKGEPFEHPQPSTAAHIDVTSESARERAERARPPSTSTDSRFQIVNVWKPLRGPLQDWPLGFCDATSVDIEQDLAEATILHHDSMNHNCQVHFNPQQHWYYLSNQETDELIIFRQFDSTKGPNNGVPHSSFQDPSTPQAALLRESVEVMAILYF